MGPPSDVFCNWLPIFNEKYNQQAILPLSMKPYRMNSCDLLLSLKYDLNTLNNGVSAVLLMT